MNIDQKALRLYVLILLPAAAAVAWFVFQKEYPSDSGENIHKGGVSVRIGDQTFDSEVASTSKAREQGLSDRASICRTCSMMFTFDTPGQYRFWMKGMLFPLDLVWVRDGKVVHIERNVPADAKGVMFPGADATEVIETNARALSSVSVGDTVVIGDGR